MPTEAILRDTYVVHNKAHLRASTHEEEALDAHGNRFVHRTQGPTGRLEVGALVSDLTPQELAAFPDRFRVATDADIDAWHAKEAAAQAALEAVPLAQDAAQLAQEQAAVQLQIATLQQQVARLETQKNTAEAQAETRRLVTTEAGPLTREQQREAARRDRERLNAEPEGPARTDASQG